MEVSIRNNSKMSKSQRRKQRSLNKAKQIIVNNNAAPNSKPRKRRSNRKRRASQSGRLRYGNPTDYYSSLTNPEFGEGAKIPDLIAFPSGTFQLTKYGVLATGNTAGDTVMLNFYPVIGDNASQWPIITGNGVASGSFVTQTNVNWDSRAAVVAAYQNFRPVSASVELYFIGNSTADGGRICGGCVYSGNVSLPTTYAGLEALPETDEWAMRNGMKVLWKPLDNTNLEYQFANASISLYPRIMIAATGLPVSTASIGYKVICNFEAIPALSYYDLIETTPSPFDTNMLRKAFEWAAESGNNIMAIVDTVGPYIQPALGLLAQGEHIANSLGYYPLPQRERRRSRARGLSFANKLVKSETLVTNEHNGKEEEDENDSSVDEAIKKFDQLEIADIVTSAKPSTSTTLRIGTPKGSPISVRKTSGQV